MVQQIKITQTSNADMNIGIPKNCHNSSNNSDTKQITMAQQTAVMQLIKFILIERRQEDGSIKFHAHEDFSRFLQMEKEQRIRDYNAGYTDAQCNHVNDAENYANEQEYLNDKEITDYTISPFGTPEKK